MLNTSKLRSLYNKIQTQLFYMIPEKWDRIYLYASITKGVNNIETGEMFFYYFPTGFLKKNPVNVYEVPTRFNIDEESYLKLVDKLYETIKDLREEFVKTGEKMWSSLTISIENLKFNVEYNYENILLSNYSSNDRHIIWKYKYLNYPIDRLSKSDQKMLKGYLLNERFENNEVNKYTEGMYKKYIHNVIEYNKEENDDSYNTQDNIQNRKYIDKYELYKEEKKEIAGSINIQKDSFKNQILNFN